MNNPSDSLDARLDARRRRRQITRKGVKEVPDVPEPHQANYCKTSPAPLDLPLAPFMALSRTSCAWISLTSKLHACMLYSRTVNMQPLTEPSTKISSFSENLRSLAEAPSRTTGRHGSKAVYGCAPGSGRSSRRGKLVPLEWLVGA